MATHPLYFRRRQRAMARGTWEGVVDTAPVANHIDDLLGAGMSLAAIARSSRVSWDTCRDLRRRLRPKIRSATANAILAVRAPSRPQARAGMADITGSMRRVQALAADGHSLRSQASHLGIDEARVYEIAHRKWANISARQARQIAAMYHLLTSMPVVETRWTCQVRTAAKRNGWVGSDAWDDHSIDDPAALPYGAHLEPDTDPDQVAVELVLTKQARYASLTSDIDKQEVVRVLAARGMDARAIATYVRSSEPVIAKVLAALAKGDEARAAA